MGLSSPAPSGTITLDDGSGPIDIAIDLELNSLQDIADAINAEATLQGSTVTASVVTEGEGDDAEYRLEITGAADVAFTDDNNILQTLQILSPELADEVQAGQDASFKINGISMTRNTNLVSGVVPGISFVLNDADPGNPVTISISSNTNSAVSAVQSFINNYNTARQYILEQTSYDPETQTAGPLLGDSAVLTVERNMFNIVGTRVANIMLEDLADLNNGEGVDGGRIQITDRSGATAEIDLTQVTSVQGVINLINASGAVSVEATTNPRGGGIMLVDTSGGTGYFEVVDLDGGSTAADLGLDQKARTNNLYGATVTTAGFTSMSNIGVTTNSNGTLGLDLSVLNEALAEDPKRIERLFSARDVGIAQVANQQLEFITQAQGGTISNRTTAIQNVIDDITDRIEVGERRLVSFEERLLNQFNRMELALAQFESQSEYLSGQFANLGNVFKYRS